MMQPAKLPKNYIERTLIDLRDGELVYTVPWAMVVDEELNCWIQTHFSYSTVPRGTMEMAVQREGGGYTVWVPKLHRYRPSNVKTLCLLPVVAVFDWKDL